MAVVTKLFGARCRGSNGRALPIKPQCELQVRSNRFAVGKCAFAGPEPRQREEEVAGRITAGAVPRLSHAAGPKWPKNVTANRMRTKMTIVPLHRQVRETTAVSDTMFMLKFQEILKIFWD